MALLMCMECDGRCEDPRGVARSRGLCVSEKEDHGRLTHIIGILIPVKSSDILMAVAGFVSEPMMCIIQYVKMNH